jgi:hypothetical protein
MIKPFVDLAQRKFENFDKPFCENLIEQNTPKA